jgi:crotonobetainyl-CoA:carnitine CoA-transferase CaiB-like acyl-CoA transferase
MNLLGREKVKPSFDKLRMPSTFHLQLLTCTLIFMLHNITVLDMSRILAGPYCTQLLADLGATVWKLEPRQGDDTRRWGPPFEAGESAYYLSVNRGKKSISINLKTVEGQDLVRNLAKRADVLVENFKVGDLARYGLDYAALSKLNSKLIYCSITGFGQTGPRATEPGYDAALQAVSGLMSMTGEENGGPVKVGVAVVDVLTGLHAAVAILAALNERQLTNQGKYLDIALFDVALASLVNQAQATLLTNENPQRLGSAHPQIVPYQAFETSDGYFMLAVGNDAQFQRLCEVTQRLDLGRETRFQTNAGRVEHRQELLEYLSHTFKKNTTAHWLELCKQASIPASPINTLTEAFADVQVQQRNLLETLQHPLLGNLQMIASPFKASGNMSKVAPPLLGQDTADILQTVLGRSKDDLERLEQAGVIKTRDR